jgi:4-amino-4-deoxy-L-arabinose transferase-like glycosyltransferase
MITLTGIHSIPLEDHEVLVLQTTREMESRGDWVLPSFNFEPRLKKPPFNYWATATLSRLDPSSDDVQVWHGRMISLLAGLVAVLATYQAGKALFDPATGKLASLLLLSMQGYINLTHNARPDFLYSTFGVLQLFAWMAAWKAEDGTPKQRWYGWLGWGMAGLATLTKGPQLPAVFLGGLLLFMLLGKDRQRTLKVLRPFVGITVYGALVFPWWLLLQKRLEALQVDLSQTQLSGELLYNMASLKEILSLYYPLTLFSLMIPVGLVIPFLIPRVWKARSEATAPTKILLYATGVLLIAFTLGGHYRKHYLLPLLPIFAIFLARGLRTAAFPRMVGKWKHVLVALMAIVATLCLGFMVHDRGYAAVVWIGMNLVPLAWLLRQELQDADWDQGLFSTQFMKASVALTIMVTGYVAYYPSTQDRWRRSVQTFAGSIGETLHSGDLIIQWQSDTFILPLYANRQILRFDEAAKLEVYFRENQAGRSVYAVVPKLGLSAFSERFDNRLLLTAENSRHPEKELVFVKLTSIKAAAPAT